MATRPDKQTQWGSNHTKEAPGTTDPDAEMIEPSSSKRAEGWKAGEFPPAEYLNALQNEVESWIEYFDEKFQKTVGKIAASVIDWGEHGDVYVSQDSSGRHVLIHAHFSGGDAELTTDILRADYIDLSAAIHANGGEFELLDAPGSNYARMIAAALDTDEIKGQSGDEIEVRKADGSLGGSLRAANVATGYGRFRIPSSPTDGDSLLVSSSHGIDTAIYRGAGQYEITLTRGGNATVIGSVQEPVTQGPYILNASAADANGQFDVRIWDTSDTLVDANGFSIVAF